MKPKRTVVIRVIVRWEMDAMAEKIRAPILFLPYAMTSRPGYIVCYSPIGQHSEAHLRYYWEDTKPVHDLSDLQVQRLLNEYANLGERVILKVLKRRPSMTGF